MPHTAEYLCGRVVAVEVPIGEGQRAVRPASIIIAAVSIALLPGCALKEVRSKTKLGPEYRHNGSRGTDELRWTSQQGVELKWDRGVATGLTYRRRDVNDGSGSNDNGVWLDFSFPLWKAQAKPDTLARRVEELEKRLAALESQTEGEGHER